MNETSSQVRLHFPSYTALQWPSTSDASMLFSKRQSNQLSVSAWVYPNGTFNGHASIFYIDNFVALEIVNQAGAGQMRGSVRIFLKQGDSTTQAYFVDTVNIPQANWTHIVGTYVGKMCTSQFPFSIYPQRLGDSSTGGTDKQPPCILMGRTGEQWLEGRGTSMN